MVVALQRVLPRIHAKGSISAAVAVDAAITARRPNTVVVIVVVVVVIVVLVGKTVGKVGKGIQIANGKGTRSGRPR